MKLLGHSVGVCYFEKNCQAGSKMVVAFYTSANYVWGSRCSNPHQHLVWSVFCVIAFLEGVKWYLIVGLFAFSQWLTYCIRFYVLVTHIHMFFYKLFKSCIHLMGCLSFHHWSADVFYPFRYKFSLDMYITNIFSWFAACPSILLTVPLIFKTFSFDSPTYPFILWLVLLCPIW